MKVCPVCRNRFPPGSSFCPYDGQKLEVLQEWTQQHDEFLGMVLDERYRIEEKIGRGGMGVVYAARHIIIDKPVAVKILRQEYSSDPHQVERFVREAKAASRIGHPNIVDVTDFGTLENGQIYFIMEYLSGVTLAKELRDQGHLPSPRVLDLSIQICNALGAAHAKGIIHRDLKPENIFILNPSTASLGEDERGHRRDLIKLLDFGIAKITWDQDSRRLTKVGSIFGTPQYMSPEQSAGKDSDHRGDIYALGCIIYEMLTGEVPFTADTFMGTLTKHMFDKPVPPRELRPDLSIHVPIEKVILKAMEKNADERFSSMAEMADSLHDCYAVCDPENTRLAPIFSQVVVQPSEMAGLMSPNHETIHLVDGHHSPEGDITAMEDVAGSEQIPRKPQGLLIGIITLIIVLGGLLLYLLRGDNPTTTSDVLIIAVTKDQGILTLRMDRHQGGPRSHTPPTAAPGLDAGVYKANLSFITLPAGAQIMANGILIGLSPITLQIIPGQEQTYTISKPGYLVESRVVAPNTDLTMKIHLRLAPKPKVGKKIIKTPYGSVEDLRNPFKANPPPKRPGAP